MTNTKDGMDVLCARLEALKIRSEKEREILQEKCTFLSFFHILLYFINIGVVVSGADFTV